MYSIIDTYNNNNILAVGLDFVSALLTRERYEKNEKRFDFVIIDEQELLEIW